MKINVGDTVICYGVSLSGEKDYGVGYYRRIVEIKVESKIAKIYPDSEPPILIGEKPKFIVKLKNGFILKTDNLDSKYLDGCEGLPFYFNGFVGKKEELINDHKNWDVKEMLSNKVNRIERSINNLDYTNTNIDKLNKALNNVLDVLNDLKM